jgi:hypothetical protein
MLSARSLLILPEGYEKGLSDAVKRDYWSMQEAQRYAR